VVLNVRNKIYDYHIVIFGYGGKAGEVWSQGRNLGRTCKKIDGGIRSMSEERTIEFINPNLLKRDETQPRTGFDEEYIKNLANTYDVQGVIEPLEVDENNVIILGEQRWRGALLKGLKKVPMV
jgi:ParB family chromosome partitioning protein